MSEPHSDKDLTYYQAHFDWSDQEARSIKTFVQAWFQGMGARDELDKKRRAVRKAFEMLSDIRGPVLYLARNHQTQIKVGSLKWKGGPIEWRTIEQEFGDCKQSLERSSGGQPLAVKNAKEAAEKYLREVQKALSVRDIKEAIVDCHNTVMQAQISIKPNGMNERDWVVWNIAPFFVHTETSSVEHKGRYAWSSLAEFLSPCGKRYSADTLKKAFGRIPNSTPRDITIARLLAQRRQHRPIPLRKVLHAEAFKALSQYRRR